MPSFCAVLDCVDKYGHSRTVPFHKFPTKNKELLEKWIYFTQRPKDWHPSRWTSVCGLHFCDQDYRCMENKKLLKKSAVPSVRVTKANEASNCQTKLPSTKGDFNYAVDDLEKEPELCESSSSKKGDQASVKCRLCNSCTSNHQSFAGNFEIYGVIQKCLPTLSIRQDDDMPKEICSKCLKSLESFAKFIDKVLETQATLLRQFRQEKGSNKPMERALKIKQEPVVRVKQENFEDVSALFPDDVDDAFDASTTESQLDQKIQFCDFPVLNDQDLINNCDIMEIINLSDPFIDITNCENTLAEEEQHQQLQPEIQTSISRPRTKNVLQSAHELLQSHMLIEEHNYAFAAEDFKEEWQIKNCYKTEKVEAEDYNDHVEQPCDFVDSDPLGQFNLGNFIDETNAADVAAVATVETTSNVETAPNEMERSIKPIVTSVSSFNENAITTYPPVTSFSAEPAQQHPNQNMPASRKRPNIVVLNESIVQSSHTFQLQACTICQYKFIGVESLNQHYATAHALETTTTTMAPMVTVPTENITSTTWQNDMPQQSFQMPVNNCKAEKEMALDANNLTKNMQAFNRSNEGATVTANIDVSKKRSSKNEIKILDMQQSFLHEYDYPNLIHFEQQTNMNFNAVPMNSISSYPLQAQAAIETEFPTTAAATMPAPQKSIITQQETVTSDILTAKYLALQKSYERLRLKCQRLACKGRPKKSSKGKFRFQCRNCDSNFRTILQLLRHRQTAASHAPQRRRNHFSASCPGCEKFFCHKTALFNHMRYICQSLPLSWFKCQLRTFKCRCCRLITFTHWRLYRKHEIKCRQRRKLKLNKSNPKPVGNQKKSADVQPKLALNSNPTNQSSASQQSSSVARNQRNRNRVGQGTQVPFACRMCQKVFPTSSSLNQHSITHSDLRSFECEICKRIFKRRNGLTQHVRGFHLKLKPFECAVCKRSYALKGDAKRCKHSTMNRSKIKSEAEENKPTTDS